MKTFYALLLAIAFAMLSVALIYFTKEVWQNIILTSITNEHLKITLIIIIEACLISGFIISLAACIKKGFHNLKRPLEGGIICGLFFGLINGFAFGLAGGLAFGLIDVLIFGLISGLIDGLTVWLSNGLILGLAVGLTWGLIYGLNFGLANEWEA